MSTFASTFHLPAAAITVLDRLPDGVACYDAVYDNTGQLVNFRLTYHNALFQQLMPKVYQMEPGNLMLTNFADPENTWQPIISPFREVIKSGQVAEYVLTDSGSNRTISLRTAPFSSGVVVTVRDTTTQQKQFNDLIDASLSNTLVYEPIRDATGQIQDFLIRFANQSAQRDIMRYFGREAINNTLSVVYPNSRQNGQFRHCVQVVETGQPIRTETYYPEIQAWYDTSIIKFGDSCIVTGLDITDRKRHEWQVQQQTADQERLVNELRQSNENLRQFAQVASHDLQEPLRRIQSFSDILQNQFEDNLSDGERDMTRRIQKSAKRMQMLIKDLLMYSQLATQRDPLIPVALSAVLEDVVTDLEMVIEEKKATVNVGKLPVILGSQSRLHQLFQNLIANALKFQKAHTLSVISISARLAQPDELPGEIQTQPLAFWQISVIDNGLGFDEKYKDRIFHPFQRLHDPSVFSGTGIGLAICQRVAENHGGAIDVSSQPELGSTFKVFLPVYQDAL